MGLLQEAARTVAFLEAEGKNSLSLAAAAGQGDGRNDDGGGGVQAESLRSLVDILRALAGHEGTGNQGQAEGEQMG